MGSFGNDCDSSADSREQRVSGRSPRRRRVRPQNLRYSQRRWRDFTNIRAKPFSLRMDSRSRVAAASSADEAVAAAKELGGEVVVKIQAWTTGRAGIGGVAFAKKPDDVRAHAERMLAMKVGQFPVEAVLVEEKIDIDREFFLSFAIDDAARAPMIIFAAGGGTGIEERAAATRRIPCDVNRGPLDSAVDEAVASCGLSANNAKQLNESIRKLFAAARSVEARSLEINPLVLTKSGEFVAADCRITIDDYAVGRHPELGIEIAREFDHPPTALEQVAYAVEQNDHRGTFYFAQLATAAPKGSKGLVGFHGAGGGGSMMSMDAIVNAGIYDRQFHGHERQSICIESLSRGANHSGPARSGRLFRFRLRRCQPGTILVRVRIGEGVLGTRSRHSRSDSSRRQHRRSRRGDFASHVEAPACAGRRLPQNRHACVHRRAFCRTGHQRRRQKMETAHVASAKICQRSVRHKARGKEWPCLDRHRALAGDSRRS